MVSFRSLAPALLALAGCAAAQDVEQTTSTSAESVSTQTLATTTLSSSTVSKQTTSSSSLSDLSTAGSTTFSQVVLSTTSSSQTTTFSQVVVTTTSSSQTTTFSQAVVSTTSSSQTSPSPTKSNERERPTLYSEYGCHGQNQTVEPNNRCHAFGTDLGEYFAGISIPSGTVCDWYQESNCTDKFWSYMQFPGDCQFGYFARTRAKGIKCYRDRRAF